MASHRRPKQPSRARVTVLTAAAATAVALSAQVAAHAAPSPSPKKDDVKAQIDQLQEEAEQATERFNGAKERADQLRKQADQLQDQVARGQEQMTQLQAGLAEVAGAQYRTGGIDPSVQLMLSSDPSGYLDKASSVQQASSSQAEALKGLQDQQRRLDQQKVEAAAVLASLDTTTKDLNQSKAEVNKKLKEAQDLLNSLSAADRAALKAAQQQADRASRGTERPDLGELPKASGMAGSAVALAMAQQGKPYGWGSTGPNSFDCSGLMVWAYGKAGVSLPRTSQAQGNYGTRVPSLAEAQPGDLIIYRDDRSHVAMYIGNGMVVHAPRTGDVIKVMKADGMKINTIRRV
ncbi:MULTISPECIES: NlpC/P60 family protein [unclassified Streptomyces]|uniref:C40 family peptidase n=1 Tax=Streptomycetaceae TaxID=2062 RepID=UPI002E774DE3|nr:MULTISPECIES: NlpC/P60 family protein [unclassified Streptomyces]MED7954036.1 NlpC/P60 family protein [Streptomyces sp. BE303]MEE1826011.1 NlpC/P60 family protein [Streptomyces sp. BE20]